MARTALDSAKQAYSDCVHGSYTALGASLLLALPVGIRRKAYWPILAAAAFGSAADYKMALDSDRCVAMREKLDAMMLSADK